MRKGEKVYCFNTYTEDNKEISGICEIVNFEKSTMVAVKFNNTIAHCFKYNLQNLNNIKCCPYCGSKKLYKISKVSVNNYSDSTSNEIHCDSCNKRNIKTITLEECKN